MPGNQWDKTGIGLHAAMRKRMANKEFDKRRGYRRGDLVHFSQDDVYGTGQIRV